VWEQGKPSNPTAELKASHEAAIEFVFRKMTMDKGSAEVMKLCESFRTALQRLCLSFIRYGNQLERLASCDEGPTHLLLFAREESGASSFRLGDSWHLDITDDQLSFQQTYGCADAEHTVVWTTSQGFLPCKPTEEIHLPGICRC